MKSLSDRQEPVAAPSLLDTMSVTARKRRKRAFQRIITGLQKDGMVRFLTLTSSTESPDDIQRSFRCLMMRLKRKRLVADYVKVVQLTKDGKKHLHILFRGSYIEQQFVAVLWKKIHNASVVDIRLIRGNRQRVAGYVARYCARETAGRMSYSWGWVWRGFCRDWEDLKRAWREWLMISWEDLLTFWNGCARLGIKPREEIPI